MGQWKCIYCVSPAPSAKIITESGIYTQWSSSCLNHCWAGMLLVLPPPSQPAPGAGRANLNGRARAPCASFVDARCFSPGCLPASSPAARPLPRPTTHRPLLLAAEKRRHVRAPPGRCEEAPCWLHAGGAGGGGRRSERGRASEWLDGAARGTRRRGVRQPGSRPGRE